MLMESVLELRLCVIIIGPQVKSIMYSRGTTQIVLPSPPSNNEACDTVNIDKLGMMNYCLLWTKNMRRLPMLFTFTSFQFISTRVQY